MDRENLIRLAKYLIKSFNISEYLTHTITYEEIAVNTWLPELFDEEDEVIAECVEVLFSNKRPPIFDEDGEEVIIDTTFFDFILINGWNYIIAKNIATKETMFLSTTRMIDVLINVD